MIYNESVCAMGVSSMIHGCLAFGKDWSLPVPFRTWQNTVTGPAAAELTALFGFSVFADLQAAVTTCLL